MLHRILVISKRQAERFVKRLAGNITDANQGSQVVMPCRLSPYDLARDVEHIDGVMRKCKRQCAFSFSSNNSWRLRNGSCQQAVEDHVGIKQDAHQEYFSVRYRM